MDNFISDISGQQFPSEQRILGASIRQPILKLIKKEYPSFSKDKYIAASELTRFKETYIAEFLKDESGQLSQLDQQVINSFKENKVISASLDGDNKEPESVGERVADKVAEFGGSWTFIISFILFLIVWIAANIFWLNNKGFDPYPFILLNLILSCVAALQAPVIMMSQNRQEDKDRERARNDYMVNLKAELEIRELHEKIDHLIIRKEQELVEVQRDQVEKLSFLLKKDGKNRRSI
jgi:Predicted membrane protein